MSDPANAAAIRQRALENDSLISLKALGVLGDEGTINVAVFNQNPGQGLGGSGPSHVHQTHENDDSRRPGESAGRGEDRL